MDPDNAANPNPEEDPKEQPNKESEKVEET